MEFKNQQFEVVINAGGFGQDRKLYPLCKNIPKCLLTVGNKPMIAYTLELLEKNGYHHAYIIQNFNHNSKKKVQNYLEQEYKGNIKCEIIQNQSDDSTEIDCLCSQQLLQKMTKDFIYINCDCITDFNLHQVNEFHVSNRSDITLVLREDAINQDQKVVNPSNYNYHDIFMIGEDKKIGKVINWELISSDFPFQIKNSILFSSNNLQLYTNLLDSHIYICKRNILEHIKKIIEVNDELKDFQQDFIPFIVENQINNKLMKLLLEQQQNQYKNSFSYSSQQTQKQINIFGFISSQNQCRRLNTLKDIQFCNTQILEERGINSFSEFTQNNGNNDLVQKNVISKDSKIGENSKTQKSVIGSNVVIGNNCLIKNSVIMNGVEIKDNSQIIDSFIQSKIKIGSDVQINNFQIIESIQDGARIQQTD